MSKIRMTVAYDGSDFHGFARQQGLRTVQGTLESVLERVLGQPVEVFGSGRTDAGVHAVGQVVHFTQEHGPTPDRYPYVMRRMLPKDVVVRDAQTVDEHFHARFSAKRKTYRYQILQGQSEDIFRRRFVWYVPQKLDVPSMQQAAEALVGTHDFSSFCAAATPVEDKVRTIYDLKVEPDDKGDTITVWCTGNGFLQYMVRIITGTLVDVGQGRRSAGSVAETLAKRDRTTAGQTAPPQGLTLWQVVYDADELVSLGAHSST